MVGKETLAGENLRVSRNQIAMGKDSGQFGETYAGATALLLQLATTVRSSCKTSRGYDYAFNFFTSFGYFATRREHDNSIRTIAQSLKPGGCFVMDYLNVHYAENHLVHQYDKEIDGVNYFITKWFDETHFYKKIVIEDDNLDEPLEYIEKVSKFNLGDFTEMFSYQGLQIQEVYGNYNFNSYDMKKSPRVIMIARKINTLV